MMVMVDALARPIARSPGGIYRSRMSNQFSALAVFAVVCGVNACSGNHATAGATPCALRPTDSVFASAGPVFRECAVDKKAKLTTTDIHPDASSLMGSARP